MLLHCFSHDNLGGGPHVELFLQSHCANAEINKLQSSLFNSMSEVDVLRGKVMLKNTSDYR